MSSHARHRASEHGDDGPAADAPAGDASLDDASRDDGPLDDGPRDDGPLDDGGLTAKDRSYSPASERETEVRQAESSGDDALRPGTGGPDDSGDLPAAEHLDAATVVERSTSGHRPGEN